MNNFMMLKDSATMSCAQFAILLGDSGVTMTLYVYV